LKAVLPTDWGIGDNIGTNKTVTSDIGAVWPPGRTPWLVTAGLADSQPDTEIGEATMARIGIFARELVI
jgi:beta-lactamase class A